MRMVIAYSPFAAGLFGLGVGIWYCAQNCSGHSGVDPLETTPLFLPILAVGCVLFLFRNYQRVAALTTVIGLAGTAFGHYVVRFKVMQSHGEWLRNGQVSNDRPGAYLLAFAIVVLMGLALGWWCTRPSRDQPEPKEIQV